MKIFLYCLYSGSAFEHKHSELMQIIVRAFPTSTKHVFLALDSGRDDVEISRGEDQSTCSNRFTRMKPCETANAVQHAISSFFTVG